MKRKLRRTALLGLAASVAWACDQPEPAGGGSGFTGRFEVVGSLTDSLPLVAMRDTMCVHSLLSGSTTFETDSTYSSSMVVGHECQGVQNIENDDLGIRGAKYELKGDTVFMYDDQDRLTGHGIMRGTDTLYIRGPIHTLIFVRR